MNDYMRALHQRFFREPECADVRDEIEKLRQELRELLTNQSDGSCCGWWMHRICSGKRRPLPASWPGSNWPGD